MKTYQDYEKAQDKLQFVREAISVYMAEPEYKLAVIANDYERQQNTTIRNYVKTLYDNYGRSVVDITSSNNRLCSNFFHRLNTERCTYSLGNGVYFNDDEETKQKLGYGFDSCLYDAAYKALIHGVSYIFWNLDKAHVFPATEFCPLWDEYDGTLRAGIRFWSLDWSKRPVTAVFYEEEGYTKYRTRNGNSGLDLVEIEPQRAYRQNIVSSEADGEMIVGESNYGSLPIIPLWGSKHKQSTLVGMREKIDSYDLIQSGFANDLEDCAQIYWIIGNALGMDDKDIATFRDRMKLQHVVLADTDNSTVTPYTQDIPVNARKEFLAEIRSSIYEDFGALDVHTVAAGATNDHIDAAYQTMDEEADDFEYQIIQAITQIERLNGWEEVVPQFKRNKISNQKEQVEMVMLAADYLDDETLLNKLPFVTVDEVKQILFAKDKENAERFTQEQPDQQPVDEEV